MIIAFLAVARNKWVVRHCSEVIPLLDSVERHHLVRSKLNFYCENLKAVNLYSQVPLSCATLNSHCYQEAHHFSQSVFILVLFLLIVPRIADLTIFLQLHKESTSLNRQLRFKIWFLLDFVFYAWLVRLSFLEGHPWQRSFISSFKISFHYYACLRSFETNWNWYDTLKWVSKIWYEIIICHFICTLPDVNSWKYDT